MTPIGSFTLESYLIAKEPKSGVGYISDHKRRYAKTLDYISEISGHAALEIGLTEFFQIYLNYSLGFTDVWGTSFPVRYDKKLRKEQFSVAGFEATTTVVSLDLESEFFPVEGERFDLIMLCEVIEHFDVDPMFSLIELNRILRTGGTLIISTPNSCSARNTYKACLGYRPHFFMQYQRDRSPYRHNFEHDVHSLISLVTAAGFSVEKLETFDVFEETSSDAINFLRKNNMPLSHRGDDIFLVAKKVSAPVERWPQGVYTA